MAAAERKFHEEHGHEEACCVPWDVHAPGSLAQTLDIYLDVGRMIEDHAAAGVECEFLTPCDGERPFRQIEREIPGLVMKLLPWIETAPPDAIEPPVIEVAPDGPPLSAEQRQTLREKLDQMRAGDVHLRDLWDAAAQEDPYANIAGAGTMAMWEYLIDQYWFTHPQVLAALDVLGIWTEDEAQMEPEVAPQERAERTGGGQNGVAGQKSATHSLNARRQAELNALLDTAKTTGNVEALIDVLPKKLGYLTDGQYAMFRTAVKEGIDGSNFYIDLRSMDRVRRESKKRIERQTVLMQKADDAVKAGKSVMVVSNKQLAALRAEAVQRLQQVNDPPVVFQRRRELVRYRADATGEPYLETLTEISMRGRLTDVADFVAESATGACTAAIPPRALCEDLVAYPHSPGTFPILEAITRTPVVRPDGSIFATPGYDSATRMIYVPPPGFLLPPIPDSPTKAEIEAAKEKLLDVLVDFQFESSADRANFIAFEMTPLVRPLVDVVPMAAIDSPVAGSGKGLLTDVAAIIATGEVAAVIPPPANREEWPKLLASLLDNGRTFVVFDNLHDALKSDALEAVLTKPFLQFRQLGQTRERIVPNRATWAVTGNNVAVSRDMVRRCYRIRIDPRCAQPHLRKNFRYPHLVQHCKTERANLLAALLTLIRAWHVAERPVFGGEALGTYTQWKDMVGGVLKHSRFENFLGNQRMLYSEMDVESEEWEGFLAQIHERFVVADFSVSDVVNMIHRRNIKTLPREVAKIYGSSMSHEESQPNPFFAVKLGHILRAHRGTRYGERELYLDRGEDDRHRKVARYRICLGMPASPTSTTT